MPDSESKKRWDKENIVFVSIKFQRKYDSDCIDFLEGRNKRDTICAALREYMANHAEKPTKTEYRYGMRLRGYSPGAQPRGAIRREDDPSGRYHDIVIYGWKLNDTEISNYELDPLD